MNQANISLVVLGDFLGFFKFFFENLEVYSADMCANKFPLMSIGGSVESLACADPGARTPLGVSGNYKCGHSTVNIADVKHPYPCQDTNNTAGRNAL